MEKCFRSSVKISVSDSRSATRTRAASARSIGRSRCFSMSSRMRGASTWSSGASASAWVSYRLHSPFCPSQDPASRHIASVNAGHTVMRGCRNALNVATHASCSLSPLSRSATSGPTSTSTPRTCSSSKQCGELLASCALEVAHTEIYQANDIDPRIIRTATGRLITVQALIVSEGFANDIRSCQLPALRHGIEETLGLRSQANCQRHLK